MHTVYQAQKLSLITIMKIEIVKKMIGKMEYSHERSQAVLRSELKKLQALRDKARKIIKKLVDREYQELGSTTNEIAYQETEIPPMLLVAYK